MKIPLSWLKDYVDIDDIAIDDLAHMMTMAGLEVEEIHFVGLPIPPGDVHSYKVSGMAWDPEKLVVAEIREVMPHPNADRLVLCRLYDGEQEHTVLTGAPNLFEYKGQGALKPPIKVAYAKEGAEIYDGHEPGFIKMALKRTKIRGVESYSMVCSEKELGISEEHEGIILLPEDAPVGKPLAEYMGDAVLTVAITPNMARNANVFGVAREIAALTRRTLTYPTYDFQGEGGKIDGKVKIEIRKPELNPRFVLGLIQNVEIKPSPDWVQRRLRLAGMRPINNIVDATNYVMLDIGQPLHAFDYDLLVERAGGKAPTIITRTAKKGEKLTTLDGVEHVLDDFTILVCDTAGSLSIGGIMGGAETEVSENTKNVLLEGANWDFINIRQTLSAQGLSSEAAYRFSRGVHPAMAPRGVSRGLEYMRLWAGGQICKGLVDEYPLPAKDPVVEVRTSDAKRWLGIEPSVKELADILKRLDFEVEVKGASLRAKTPDHRLDISHDPVIGKTDLMEEVARIYGYENIPETRMADELPPQRGNRALEVEEKIRDVLADLGLQEVMTYRITSPQAEARHLPPDVKPDDRPYVSLANPYSPERAVMRKSLMASVLEVVEQNSRVRERIAVFEIGPIFLTSEESPLPDELPRLVIAMTGPRQLRAWQGGESSPVDFYDVKGVLESLWDGLHLESIHYQPHQHPVFHGGTCARVLSGERQIGVFGELHPSVHAQYDLPATPLIAAAIDMAVLIELAPDRHEIRPVPAFPPLLEDLAVVVDESVPAEQVANLIAQTGGKTVTEVRLFDLFRGEQIGKGKKSLAYSLTYQAEDRTLTDDEVAKIRQKIVKRLESELGAQLRT